MLKTPARIALITPGQQPQAPGGEQRHCGADAVIPLADRVAAQRDRALGG
jgi:hypothetical protein